MRATIEFFDDTSLTAEEVIKTAKRNYGQNAKVTISPVSPMPHDILYFALQQMITNEQLIIFYDNKENYQVAIKALRSDIMFKVGEILDTLIIDNEAKVS